MTNNSVLISGASIAGPALAYWLRKAGYATTVVERAPALRPGGQTVDLRGAGRTVVSRMGLMDRARSVTVDQRGAALVNRKGRIIGSLPVDAFGGEGIISEIEILRGDLAEVLYEATLPDTEYLFDDTITGLSQDEDGVHVTFERSAPRRFAYVFGADGVHSAVRAHAFGPESRYLRPLGLYGPWFTAKETLDLDGWMVLYNEPGGLVVGARPGRLPGEIKVSMGFRAKSLDYDRRDIEAQKRIVAERFAGAGWETARLVRAMWDSPDFVFDGTSQVRMDRWSNGRIALLGDAACCPSSLTGLGTSVALVGAYLLAGELARARGDHRVAFARYEELMRPYVTKAQELPPGGVAGLAPKSAALCAMRGLSMRMMTRWPMKNMIASSFEKAADIDLPDYENLMSQR